MKMFTIKNKSDTTTTFETSVLPTLSGHLWPGAAFKEVLISLQGRSIQFLNQFVYLTVEALPTVSLITF